jgi:hypothetical protein
MSSLRSQVIQLYKQFLWASRSYPAGYAAARGKVKDGFMKMKNEKDPAKITEGIERGKYIIKELEALHQLHKYRALKKSYYGSDPAE